jgi:very-short-patch-repair endonuclease
MTNSLKAFAKELRKRPTDAEKLLWKYLRLKRLEGLKFRRQYPLDHYIVDFICLEKRLVVEVDGGQHSEEKDKDIKRDAYLNQQGFKVLRFWNNEALRNTEGVLEIIRRNCL